MLQKIKQYLGIEGVKIAVEVPPHISKAYRAVEGKIRLTSMHTQTVEKIQLKLMEKYQRGRRGGKLSDEFKLGAVTIERPIMVPANVPIEVSFVLPFDPLYSAMDTLQQKNLLMKGVVATAKMLKGVKSEYRIEATAYVQGTKLSPFVTTAVNIV